LRFFDDICDWLNGKHFKVFIFQTEKYVL